ncbi:MAG: iron-containing alcohol dehydrogenase [Spirochaetota bacterium]
MKLSTRLRYRTVQRSLHIASHFLPWRTPRVVEGAGSRRRIPEIIADLGIHKVLVVTDNTILKIGLLDSLLKVCHKNDIAYEIFSHTVPNPTIANVESAFDCFEQCGCDGVLACGGGSPLDCAKALTARISNPDKSLSEMAGILKVKRRTVPLIAVPTTAGTGSEATLAAVLHDPTIQKKFAINDVCLIPDCAVLDPDLLTGLPPHITAATGMDTLCHAVEAYIGKSTTRTTRRLSREAVQLVFQNLLTSYYNGSHLEARQNMHTASFKAGQAFTRAYVGNIHAISHTLGAFYGIPHGLANAILLPIVLDYYGESVHTQLADLADVIEVGSTVCTKEKKAAAFIHAIRQLNSQMRIPESLNTIRQEDIPKMVHHALEEANPLYPVPRIFDSEDMTTIYVQMKTGTKGKAYAHEIRN